MALEIFESRFYISIGFVRYEEKECDYDAKNELKSFKDLNDSKIAHINARDECEQHCSNVPSCWGCTFNCDNDCKWIAISECNDFKVNGLGNGGATQKPGIHIVKVFFIFHHAQTPIMLYDRALFSFPYL